MKYGTLLKYWEEPNKDCGDVDDLLDEHIQAVETRIKELKQLKITSECFTEKMR